MSTYYELAVSGLQQLSIYLSSKDSSILMCFFYLRPAVLPGRYPGSTDENTWNRQWTGLPVQGLPRPAAQPVSFLQHLDCCATDDWINTRTTTRGSFVSPGLLL